MREYLFAIAVGRYVCICFWANVRLNCWFDLMFRRQISVISFFMLAMAI